MSVKKVTILITSISLMVCFYVDLSFAYDWSFQLSTNRNALDSAFDASFDIPDSRILTGVRGLYDSEDFKLLFIKAIISNEIFIDGLSAGLGFKGTCGEAEKNDHDTDVLNLGFAVSAVYDLSKSVSQNVPITLSAGVNMSPEPLAFGDTEYLIEVLTEISWQVIRYAAVVASYRYIEIDFDRSPLKHKSNSDGYLGLKFLF